MKDFSIAMALVDFIPVILFVIASAIMQNDLYNKMSKASFALLSAGLVNVFAAGGLKALYKLLYAANICDFEPLNAMFFPVQSMGFMMAGMGMMLMFWKKRKYGVTTLSVAPVVYKGTFIFVGLMVIGLACMETGLGYFAIKMKKRSALGLFVFSFVCSLCMGYLSSKDFVQASMNWIAEMVNIMGQGCLLWGVLILHKAGLTEFQFEGNK